MRPPGNLVPARKVFHISFPGQISYLKASAAQDLIVRRLLDYKASPSAFIFANGLNTPPTVPSIVMTMQMEPTYTCGRRERGTVSEEQRIELENGGVLGRAKFVEAQRGGQTTFHGPGQMVAYPIIDLKSFNITPRCYVSMLEKVLISLLNSYSISAQTTENTGVWTDEEHKIAAIGIHVRRNITSHGIALNIDTNLGWFKRIIACGLPDKQTTTMKEQLGREVAVCDVESGFVNELARKLHCNIGDIVTVATEELDAGMNETAFTLAVGELLETRGVLPMKSQTC